jgi:FkbM family methyltransferase
VTHAKHRPDIELIDTKAAKEIFAVDICRILGQPSVVLDIGANRGQFALNLLEIVDVKIINCFEPVPAAYKELERVAANEPRIRPFQAAISCKTEKLPFYVTESDVGSSLLKPISGQPSKWLTFDNRIMVDSYRIDYLIEKQIMGNLPGIDLLKSDAQGVDKVVLESAGIYLNPDFIKGILVEVSFSDFYEGQDGYSDVFSLLDKKGYRPARIYPHRAYDDWLWWADVLFLKKQ